ncbi:probable magnesium-dependent phosphatase 1 [Coccomyxa sp. Obi]|nr:probable magnesium-dependent phosphatase 1 [Coccomyxa sp. Obi]
MAEPSAPPPAATSFEKAVALLSKLSVLPSIVLFNVEGVLWQDAAPGADAAPYPDAAGIQAALRFKGVRVGATMHREESRHLLLKLCAESFQPTVLHRADDPSATFREVKEKLGIPFGQMLLFDANVSRVRAAASLGMTAQRLLNGLTLTDFEKGLRAFVDRDLDSRGF